MMYEQEGNEIITGAADVLWDNITFAVTDDKMLVDDGYTYVNAGLNGVEGRWNDEMISEIVLKYGCKLQDREIVRKIFGDNIEGAIMSIDLGHQKAHDAIWKGMAKTLRAASVGTIGWEEAYQDLKRYQRKSDELRYKEKQETQKRMFDLALQTFKRRDHNEKR